MSQPPSPLSPNPASHVDVGAPSSAGQPEPRPRSTSPLPKAPAPALVALVGWLCPGGGYFLLDQRLRGVVIGLTVLAMFVAGLLIGGVRIIDVPGWDDAGRRVFVYLRNSARHPQQIVEVRNTTDTGRWILRVHPINEIANKPWIVPQLVTGPVAIVSAYASLRVARPNPAASPPSGGVPKSHGRLWEIGTLYTAIAGMLNLLAIIDASYRAGQLQPQPEPEPEHAEEGLPMPAVAETEPSGSSSEAAASA